MKNSPIAIGLFLLLITYTLSSNLLKVFEVNSTHLDIDKGKWYYFSVDNINLFILDQRFGAFHSFI